MVTTKVFENGGSQAVRIPKEYRFVDKEINVNKIMGIVTLSPKEASWNSFFGAIDLFSGSFANTLDEIKAPGTAGVNEIHA